MDRRDTETWPETSRVMESFQTRTHTLAKHAECFQNVMCRDRMAAVGSETVAGRDGALLGLTLNVYMKLCGCWRQSEMGLCSLGKKDALFL